MDFISEMEEALTEIGRLDSQLTILKIKREDLRAKLKKWMEINNLTSYDSFDSIRENFYRLSITSSIKRSCDFNMLQAAYPEAYDQCIKKTDSEVFSCRPVKTRKDRSSPTSPSENI